MIRATLILAGRRYFFQWSRLARPANDGRA
jgi:hypothetical protein